MPYKIIFLLFLSFIFCGNCYADCSSQQITDIKESLQHYKSNVKITFFSKDNKCRYIASDDTAYGWRYESTMLRDDNNVTYADGIQTVYYVNGVKKEESFKVMSKINGLLTRWHKNGVKQAEENYKDNFIDGLVTTWNDKGEKISEMIYVNGLRKTDQTLTENGPNDTSNQDPIEIAKNTCKKLGLKEKTEKFGICVLKNIN